MRYGKVPMKLRGDGMIIGLKDSIKLIGISIITGCAVFVCTLFLNFNIDITAMKDEITSEAGAALYDALVSMGRFTAVISGGCLAVTSVVVLLFYVKNYIDTHRKELGILKALGYGRLTKAKHFGVFGLSIFLGGLVGFAAAFLYLPSFYLQQNAEGLFPEITVRFHIILPLSLIVLPTIFFAGTAVLFAYRKLGRPTLHLLKEIQEHKTKKQKEKRKDRPFLKELSGSVLRDKKVLCFFIAFSAFCFSAMVQMSFSMEELASKNMAAIVLIIGIVLAFTILFILLSTVVKGNAKTIALMRVMGYEDRKSNRAILGVYRPFAYIGFALGTVYQYGLLRIVLAAFFSELETPEYHFDFAGFLITLAVFMVVYELAMGFYAWRTKHVPVKSIMLEN